MLGIYLYGDSHGQIFKKREFAISQHRPNECKFITRIVAPARILDNLVLFDKQGVKTLNPALYFPLLKDSFVNKTNYNKSEKKDLKRHVIILLGTADGHRLSLNTNFGHLTSAKLRAGKIERDTSKIYVPINALKELALERMESFFDGIKILKTQEAFEFSIMASPPATPSDEFIFESQPSAKSALERSKKLFAKKGNIIPDKEFRLQRWKINNDIVKEFCEKNNINFIENPEFVFDNLGFLRQKYWRDGIHANEKYAIDVGKHIVDELLMKTSKGGN